MKNPSLSKRAIILTAATLLLAGAAVVFVIKSKLLLIRGEDVAIASGDVTLTATLALPRSGNGPFPAVVVVHGSGRVTRRDLRSYGGQLVPQGMAVLFYDKRGVGESTGRFRPFRVADCETLIRELATDVLAAVSYLKERKDVDASRIGLIGGSQAGWIMPLAASQSGDIAFIINLAGPAVTCGQVEYYQQLTGANGGTPAEISDAEINERVGRFDGPQGYDPLPVLESVSVPMLWMLGGKDLNVPSALTASIVERLVEDGHANHTIKIYPDADHDFHHAGTGRLIDPLPDIRTWLESIKVLRQ